MPLSEIYWMNLNFLQILQKHINRDLATACYRFNLNADNARQIGSLNQEQLHALVTNYGAESLFKFREDIVRLIPLPPGLQAPLAAVASSTARRRASDFAPKRRTA